jgi:hypothetical protein
MMPDWAGGGQQRQVRLRGRSLSGFIATAALNRTSVLPHWVELKKSR